MEQGKILSWSVKVGDEIMEGDAVAEIETDKSTLFLEIQQDGFVAKFLVEDFSTPIKIGEPILIVVSEKDDIAAFKNYTGGDTEGGQEEAESDPIEEEPQQKTSPEQSPSIAKPSGDSDRVFISPLAKKIAQDQGISIEQLKGIHGSGDRGRIIAQDLK